jgi:hypothetical protein
MQGSGFSKEEEATLSAIIRSIDKKLDYSIHTGSGAAGPNLTLHLARQGWEGNMALNIEDLRTAKTDLVYRNKIRQKIKRFRDHMWDGGFIKDVLGTKAANMLRAAASSEDSSRRQFMRRPVRR